MNMKNLEFLTNKVFFTGFGPVLDREIQAQLEKGEEKFQLQHQTAFNGRLVDSTLNFSRSKESDLYFFNQYQVSLKPENGIEEMKQTFFVGKENNITLKEAYNLMNGRAVLKEWNTLENVGSAENPRFVPTAEKYLAWVQLDFKNADANGNYKQTKFHENYGFNLAETLSKLPIAELKNEEHKQHLLESLKKGNLQSATLITGEAEQKIFLVAKPQFKRIGVYSEFQQEINIYPAAKRDQSQEQRNEQSLDRPNQKSKGQKTSMS